MPTSPLRCQECLRKLFKTTKIKPRSISEWDIEHKYLRDEVYICCGMIRMKNPHNAELFAYPLLPEDTEEI